ncbi:MAG: tetratricopeptide repeat protein [Ramlibacter sp.]
MTASESDLLAVLGYVFLQNARPDKAAVVFAALDVMEPGRPQVLRSLVIAQLRCGKVTKALETLDRLAMTGGVDAAFHLLRTQAMGMSNRREEAAASMKTYIHLRQAAATGPVP